MSLSPFNCFLSLPFCEFYVAKLICSDTNCCVHNSKYHTYYDINCWEIRKSLLTTSSTPWDRLPRTHKMNIKRYKKKTHNLTWFGPNFAYVHGERIWERFINKIDTKRSNIPLDATRVFTFFLNLDLNYKSIQSLYVPSSCSSLSWLFRTLHLYFLSCATLLQL